VTRLEKLWTNFGGAMMRTIIITGTMLCSSFLGTMFLDNTSVLNFEDAKCRIEYLKSGRYIKVTGATCEEARQKLKELLEQ